MNATLSTTGGARAAQGASRFACALGAIVMRTLALVVFVLMSLAEPFLAMALGALSLASFVVAVLFGFILREPFAHRWEVLGASVLFLLAYLLYRALMLGVQRLLA